jgi:2-polyprenyl-3-methyl-5-hydroxy-6-metoxy-1,4-benzoquinol methylase
MQALIPKYHKVRPWDAFHSDSYLEITFRRLEHLSSLQINFDGKSVLELGAGIGDLTGYFVSRSCKVTSTDSRPQLVKILQKRFKHIEASLLDLEKNLPNNVKPHQVVFSYGVLHHVSNPRKTISLMSDLTTELLILETCVVAGGNIKKIL